MTPPELNVSLEPHLLVALKELPPHLPDPLATQLAPFLVTPPTAIPYSLLSSISQWARSPEFPTTTKLDPQGYTMIALLAGTVTSPERVFPKYIAPDPFAARTAELDDAKAITTLINALLSVLGAGFATWWAADMTGWKNEWKVLLALLASVVVAIAEAGLFLIWQSRKTAKASRPKALAQRGKEKKDETEDIEPVEPTALLHGTDPNTLRLRRPQDEGENP